MKVSSGRIRLSASDLSNHLACRHLTTLDLGAARGELAKPAWADPDSKVRAELGLQFEKRYLAHLAKLEAVGDGRKLEVMSLTEIKHDDQRVLKETAAAMERGVDVIAQGALGDGEWFGRPDVLRRMEVGDGKWAWSYEVTDTKLARETKATTILQLSLYSQLLKEAQGIEPEFLCVVTPSAGGGFKEEKYRVAEYTAYYRYVRNRLVKSVAERAERETYPEPVEHCNVCRWFKECDRRRRADDHLSLVAGIRRQQRDQFEKWDTETMAKLAVLPLPLKERPSHGSKAGYENVMDQARVQVEGRSQGRIIHKGLRVEPGAGLCLLPEPSAGDMFVDFEGDPFAGGFETAGGQEYLFGFVAQEGKKKLCYEKRWALTAEAEKAGFEWLVDEVMLRWKELPTMHVYHFTAHEPSAFKRLMGRHATREEEVDSMLRAGLFVDLHTVLRQAVRASVEEYSLKKLEELYRFARKIPKEESRAAMRYIDHRLELGWDGEELPEKYRAAMEGYNGEDCFSTAAMRDWLEKERDDKLRGGAEIPRPAPRDGSPPEDVDERQKRVAALSEELTADVPAELAERSEEQQARWLLAQLLDWHRREDKSTYWEGYRLKDLDEEGLLEDRAGLAGLKFVARLRVERKIPVDRYSFEKQETEVRKGKNLRWQGEDFGTIEELDPAARLIDIKKTRKTADFHPSAVYMWDRPYNVDQQKESVFRLGEWVVANGVDAKGSYRAARDLLLRRPPRLPVGEKLEQLASERPESTASRIAVAMSESIFAIQGPPGSGKTYAGARMICELVKGGKRVGVTALSHKVIRNLLDTVVEAAHQKDVGEVRCLHRDRNGVESPGVAVAKESNEEALDAISSGKANVLGGVSWLWSPESAFEVVDVLVVDEAGQMSLADVLAISQAGSSLVLLGDPQQLEHPLQGSHPVGAEKSALEHLLNGKKTISSDLGFLLPETWRLHPKICRYTSGIFYEGKLGSHATAESRVLEGHKWLSSAGMWFVPVEHEGNRNSSAEEVEVVARIVESLLIPEVEWFYSKGNKAQLPEDQILIVAPYNAQVTDLAERLPNVRVGTVDKFQGQEAAVVIYSLTTSSPEDIPHGMEFLFSLNRLNVATSRAMTAVIVVGSPRLFEPECRTPRQMQLANALCAYREMATEVDVGKI